MKENRTPSIDLIKAIASISVTAVHFRNRLEGLIIKKSVTEFHTLFFSANYSFFIFGVPLFLLSTGYLSLNRTISKKHYLGVLKVYLMYLFMALIGYQILVFTGNREPISFLEMLIKAIKFKLVSGWYIELYVGLAMVIPFLNILIKNISKKQHLLLIFILIITVSLPALTNRNPFISRFIYLPNFYENLYPVVYYFIGAYIKLHYQTSKSSNRILVSIFILSIIFIWAITYKYANPYTRSVEGYYASIVNVALATSFFLLIFNNYKKKNSKLTVTISKYTLSTYIMAYPIDKTLYPVLLGYFGSIDTLILYSPIVVIILFAFTLLAGMFLTKIYNFFWELFRKSAFPDKKMINDSE